MKYLNQHEISLIILDLNFSIETLGEEGMALLQKIRRINTEVPVILITGWGRIQLAVQGMKLGANDFITKPWNNDYLLQSARTLLNLQEKKQNITHANNLTAYTTFNTLSEKTNACLICLETVGRVAATDASVLIMGESGTGKRINC